ncbi:MAG: PIN domain-containing protein [archaeon]
MTEHNLLMDSSAWIEYFNGTKPGQKVKELIENEKYLVLNPNIVAAEVTSKIARFGGNVEKAITAIKTLSIPVREDQELFFEAGKQHFHLKKKFKNISLADSIIKTIAEKNNAVIVTKDRHLNGKKTILI